MVCGRRGYGAARAQALGHGIAWPHVVSLDGPRRRGWALALGRYKDCRHTHMNGAGRNRGGRRRRREQVQAGAAALGY